MFFKKGISRRNLLLLALVIGGYFLFTYIYQGRDIGDNKEKM